MGWLFFAGEAPGDGGYLVAWHRQAPPVHRCRPRLEQLCLYDWQGRRNWLRRPAEDRLSWRIIDHEGSCWAHFDAPGRAGREDAWLAGVDLQLERGRITAREPGSLLVLVAGRLRLTAGRRFQAVLARAHHFVDYRLGFRGPDGEMLGEASGADSGHYRFLEKHEGVVIADPDDGDASLKR